MPSYVSPALGLFVGVSLNLVPFAPKRRWFRATGYPVFEVFFAMLFLMGTAVAIVVPILQWLFR